MTHVTGPANWWKTHRTDDARTVHPWKTVVTCYSAVDKFFPTCGLFDLTEGIYAGDPDTPFDVAQRRQHDYLLNQVRCEAQQRLLDLGCGYGTLMERVRERHAIPIGITVSPEQLKHCRRKQLDVHPFDYRALPIQWDQNFDAVIANGSIEHFVRPVDAAAGYADAIYNKLFSIVHRLINPESPARRFATTTIHFVRTPRTPRDLLKNPFAFRWGSDNFHWAVLVRGWGGYYPELGQLQRCADPYFKLVEEIDGTQDYLFTSEEWLRRVREALMSPGLVRIALRSLATAVRSPRQFLTLLLAVLLSDSWNWQFRTPGAPTRLLRHTWAYRE